MPTWLITTAPDDEQDDEEPAPHGFEPLRRPRELSALGLPAGVVDALKRLERGLVVLGGLPGSGRSTTLTALLQHLGTDQELAVLRARR